MLQLKMYDSIHEVDRQHWDSILHTDDIFHNWQFIRAVEDGRVENSRFRYLLFYKGDELIASTVLSAFTISLDIFINDAAWVRQVKKWRPGFFNINMLTCGLPASFGQLNIKIADEILADEVCSLVADKMKVLGKEWKIRFLCVKEFLEHNKKLGRQFLQDGFFLANSIPYMRMQLEWETFAEYLNSLRHPYRRHIIKSMHKINREEPMITRAEEYDKNSQEVKWVLSDPGWIGAKQFCDLYLQVMERSKTKLETLNEEFFNELFKDKGQYQALSLMTGGKILSAALLVPHGDTLTFMLVGRTHEKDEYDSYFNLLYGIIAHAILGKFKRISQGQTAYWVKQSIGGTPENQYLYFGCTGKLWHWLLKSMNRLMFPKIRLKPIKVFKEKKNAIAILSK